MAMKRARFEVYQSMVDRQRWYWRLKARNGEIIASSEAYTTYYAACRGVKAVRRAAPFAKLETIKT